MFNVFPSFFLTNRRNVYDKIYGNALQVSSEEMRRVLKYMGFHPSDDMSNIVENDSIFSNNNNTSLARIYSVFSSRFVFAAPVL